MRGPKYIAQYHLLKDKDDAKECTPKDWDRIAEAEKLRYIDWGRAADLEDEAESEYARRVIHSIRTYLYHMEEASAGLL
jgi:hypothetical protein